MWWLPTHDYPIGRQDLHDDLCNLCRSLSLVIIHSYVILLWCCFRVINFPVVISFKTRTHNINIIKFSIKIDPEGRNQSEYEIISIFCGLFFITHEWLSGPRPLDHETTNCTSLYIWTKRYDVTCFRDYTMIHGIRSGAKKNHEKGECALLCRISMTRITIWSRVFESKGSKSEWSVMWVQKFSQNHFTRRILGVMWEWNQNLLSSLFEGVF